MSDSIPVTFHFNLADTHLLSQKLTASLLHYHSLANTQCESILDSKNETRLFRVVTCEFDILCFVVDFVQEKHKLDGSA